MGRGTGVPSGRGAQGGSLLGPGKPLPPQPCSPGRSAGPWPPAAARTHPGFLCGRRSLVAPDTRPGVSLSCVQAAGTRCSQLSCRRLSSCGVAPCLGPGLGLLHAGPRARQWVVS